MVQMENIDEQLKINIHGILPSISEEVVECIIGALKYVGLEMMSDLKYVQEEDLILILKPIQRRKLVEAWSEQTVFSNKARSAFLPSENPNEYRKHQEINENTTVSTNEAKCAFELFKNPNNSKNFHEINENTIASFIEARSALEFSRNPDESKKYQKINKNATFSFNEVRNVLESSENPEKLKNFQEINESKTVSCKEERSSFEPSKNSGIPPFKSSNFSSENYYAKDRKSLVLMQVYAKYKAELSRSDVNEKEDIWRIIAEEVRQRCSAKYDELQCKNKIKSLKGAYYRIKYNKEYVDNEKTAIFFNEARNVFDPNFDPSRSPVNCPVNASSNLISCAWNQRKIIKVLRHYAKYKTELSDPCVEEQTMWNKISSGIKKCDELQCRNKINELRREYEKIKNENVMSRETAIFLDEAKEAFENTPQSPEKPKALYKGIGLKNSKKDFLCNLLHVYAKFKTKLTSPDNEEQKVWAKIAEEMRETFYYDCGEILCRFELLQLKCYYESVKRGESVKNGNMADLFDEARKVFESSENLVTPSLQVEDKIKADIYYPPSMTEEANKGSKSRDKITTLKISNLSTDVCISYAEKLSKLIELFKSFGIIARIYLAKEKETGLPQDFAFVKYQRHEDAARAIQAVNGVQLDSQILSVEWAKPSSTNEILGIN